MLRRNLHQRAGITLIELLVVIAIIATLLGLLLSAVMRVLDVGPRGDTTSRMAALNNAINTFKAERSVTYIPAGSVDLNRSSPTYGQVVGPFRLRRSYMSTTNPSDQSFEAQYIKQIFPQAELSDLGDGLPGDADLDANQTLLFFLNGTWSSNGQGGFAFQGFSKNPLRPFASPASAENRMRPLLDISTKHTAAGPNGYPWLTDGWKRPMAYFVAFNGKPARLGSGQYGGINDRYTGINGAVMNTPQPYYNGSAYVNESGFQIISAGKDGRFGGTGNWNGIDADGQDDRANFSTANLGFGPR